MHSQSSNLYQHWKIKLSKMPYHTTFKNKIKIKIILDTGPGSASMIQDPGSSSAEKCQIHRIMQFWKSGKMVLDPDSRIKSVPKINHFLFGPMSFHTIWFKYVNNFLRYPVHRQTDRQTDRRQ